MRRFLAVSMVVGFAFLALACSESTSDSAAFEGGPGMLYFYSPDCPVCQGMKPIVDALEHKYADGFKFVRVNVETDRGKERARAHGLIGQPAYLFFDGSNRQVRRLMGAHSQATLEQAIEQTLQGE